MRWHKSGQLTNEKGVYDMRQGALIFDEEQDRMDIRFDLDSYYGGLHCGDTMKVLVSGKLVSTSIEKGRDWYLTGIKTKSLPGLIVRI